MRGSVPACTTSSRPEIAAVNAKQDADLKTRIVEFEPRLRNLDAMGIDMQVIKPPPGQCYYTLPVDIGVKAAQTGQ